MSFDHLSSLEKCLFRYSAHFLNQVVFGFGIGFYEFFIYFAYFSPHQTFICRYDIFILLKLLNLSPICLFLLLFPLPEETDPKKIFLSLILKCILIMFSFKNFLVSGLSFFFFLSFLGHTCGMFLKVPRSNQSYTTGLSHSHSNTGSEPHLWATP